MELGWVRMYIHRQIHRLEVGVIQVVIYPEVKLIDWYSASGVLSFTGITTILEIVLIAILVAILILTIFLLLNVIYTQFSKASANMAPRCLADILAVFKG
ncbi:hypothetical protein BJ742DRAFT_767938 [Cladochytrium replicatum]|nr:hypothetical protein BJ742DRAFT_767938 [Cladochytrium replicatum]